MQNQQNDYEEDDDWDVDPDEAEKRKGKSLDLQTSYWSFKGNSDTLSRDKSTDTLDAIEGPILDIKETQKMWPPYPSSENGKKQLKILKKEGITLPAKTLICERRDTLSNPRINENLLSDPNQKATVDWLKANGAGKSCEGCRFSKPEEYDGDTVPPMCVAARRVYMMGLENGAPVDVKVVEAKSEKAIKAIDSFTATIDSRRPLMSYISRLSIESFKSKSGTVFYKLKLAILENTPKTIKEVVTKARDRITGRLGSSNSAGGTDVPDGNEPRQHGSYGSKQDKDLGAEEIPF